MPARKTETEGSVEVAPAKTNSALPGKEVRQLKDVAMEIRRLRDEEQLDHEQIREVLQVSYDVINQLVLQSYKMAMNTGEVFEAQEKLRLGL